MVVGNWFILFALAYSDDERREKYIKFRVRAHEIRMLHAT
jgi:hypothetical protein